MKKIIFTILAMLSVSVFGAEKITKKNYEEFTVLEALKADTGHLVKIKAHFSSKLKVDAKTEKDRYWFVLSDDTGDMLANLKNIKNRHSFPLGFDNEGVEVKGRVVRGKETSMIQVHEVKVLPKEQE